MARALSIATGSGVGTRKAIGAGDSSVPTLASVAAGTIATASAASASFRRRGSSQPASLTIACGTRASPRASHALQR